MTNLSLVVGMLQKQKKVIEEKLSTGECGCRSTQGCGQKRGRTNSDCWATARDVRVGSQANRSGSKSSLGKVASYEEASGLEGRRDFFSYCSFAYSVLASFRMGMSGSAASFTVGSDFAVPRFRSGILLLRLAIR